MKQFKFHKKTIKKTIIKIPKVCFLCSNFTFGEFRDENVKLCAENWLNAENCPNYIPPKAFFPNKELIIKVVKMEAKI